MWFSTLSFGFSLSFAFLRDQIKAIRAAVSLFAVDFYLQDMYKTGIQYQSWACLESLWELKPSPFCHLFPHLSSLPTMRHSFRDWPTSSQCYCVITMEWVSVFLWFTVSIIHQTHSELSKYSLRDVACITDQRAF